MHNFSFSSYSENPLPENSSHCDNPLPGEDLRALPKGKRPSDTIPVLSLEVAAREESFLLRRDAEIACCFGFKVRRLTALRQSPEPSKHLHWELLERRWLTDGPAISAATQKRREAFQKMRAERLRLQAAEDAAYRHRQAPALKAHKAQKSDKVPLHWLLRATLLLLDFPVWLLGTLSSGRVIVPVVGCILGYLLLDALTPGFWESLFAEAKTFLTGVTP